MSSQRKAGDNLYGGVEQYGNWSDTWDNNAAQQQLKASGRYDETSDYAKQFSKLQEDGGSRIDDEQGWREISIDGSKRDPRAYANVANEWSSAGFDVRAIDMNKKFGGSNMAVRRRATPYAEPPQPAKEPAAEPVKKAAAKPAPQAEPTPARVEAKEKAKAFAGPSREYFADAVKRHGFEGKGKLGDADFLLQEYKKATKGLDPDLAWQALGGHVAGQGGRAFGENDLKRYNALLKAKNNSSAPKPDPKPAPAPVEPKPDPVKPKPSPTPVTIKGKGINNSFNAEGGTLDNSGNLQSEKDIELNNSVANKNFLNQFAGDKRDFKVTSGGTRKAGEASIDPKPLAKPAPKPAAVKPAPTPKPKAQPVVKPTQRQTTQSVGATKTPINESYNAQGGSFSNSGNVQADGNITFDNSVTNQNTLNQFGGDVRQFTYNAPGYNSGGSTGGGGMGDGRQGGQYPTMNSYKDPALNATPVSAATMAGFYQPSDSPAAAAKRTALHSTLNDSRQQKYEGTGSKVAKQYVDAARNMTNINTKKLSANLAVQPYVDEARSNVTLSDTFGDIWKFKPESFKMPGGFVKPEQPDFEGMFENITDKITEG